MSKSNLKEKKFPIFNFMTSEHFFFFSKEGIIYTRLKTKIENNSTWESAFYQSERAKINTSSVILVFSFYVCCC